MPKVCILAAGKGSRSNYFDNLHKGLWPTKNNKAIISELISYIPEDLEIVVAVGHLKEQLISYLELIYPNRKIKFIEVDYISSGSGPGSSLLQCKNELQCPFIWMPIDIITEKNIIDELIKTNNNFIFINDIDSNETKSYSYFNANTGMFSQKNETNTIFSGLAKIVNYKKFWSNLESNKNLINNELQVINGLNDLFLFYKRTNLILDVGNNSKYLEYIDKKHIKKDNITFIENGKVIKWFSDYTSNDIWQYRSKVINNCPEVNLLNENMSYYDYIEGLTLGSSNINNFLDFLQSYYDSINKMESTWHEKKTTISILYVNKLLDRLEPFLFSDLDKIDLINDTKVKPIIDYIKQIDFYNKIPIIPCLFHGDLQAENIIISEDGSIKLIDWRSGPYIGDFYYDLAKLYHSFIVSKRTSNDIQYDEYFKIESDNIHINHLLKYNLSNYLSDLFKFCDNNKIDKYIVKLLGVLQFLGIASIYLNTDERYAKFLFAFGKLELHKLLNERFN